MMIRCYLTVSMMSLVLPFLSSEILLGWVLLLPESLREIGQVWREHCLDGSGFLCKMIITIHTLKEYHIFWSFPIKPIFHI